MTQEPHFEDTGYSKYDCRASYDGSSGVDTRECEDRVTALVDALEAAYGYIEGHTEGPAPLGPDKHYDEACRLLALISEAIR